MAKYTSICRARHNQIKKLSCSEIVLNNIGLNALPNDSMSKSCDDLSAKIRFRIQQQNEVNYIPESRTQSQLKYQSRSSRCVNEYALPFIQITIQNEISLISCWFFLPCSPPETSSPPVYRIMPSVSFQKQDSEVNFTSSSIRGKQWSSLWF